MHGSKRFIVVGDSYSYERRYPFLTDRRRHAHGGRIKRSRHRTTVDVYLLAETAIKFIAHGYADASAPREWRKFTNRRYRARTRHLLRHERYEDVGPPSRDGRWYW